MACCQQLQQGVTFTARKPLHLQRCCEGVIQLFQKQTVIYAPCGLSAENNARIAVLQMAAGRQGRSAPPRPAACSGRSAPPQGAAIFLFYAPRRTVSNALFSARHAGSGFQGRVDPFSASLPRKTRRWQRSARHTRRVRLSLRCTPPACVGPQLPRSAGTCKDNNGTKDHTE